MPRMINADLLLEKLAREVLALANETRGQSGFDALISSSACLAVDRVRRAIESSLVKGD